MSTDPHVMVCVLTYKRTPELLALLPLLLDEVGATGRPGRVLVVDNDPAGGASGPVAALGEPLVTYVNEVRPGIAAARNRALAEARDDELLVFIDDDETPVAGWLTHLVAQHASTRACAVVGPVRSTYAQPLSPWVAAGRFFDRRQLPTGTRVEVAATNNLLLDVAQLRTVGLVFDEAFGLSGGSDTLFTRQIVAAGRSMVWCAEAVVLDQVPVGRLSRRWVLQKALRSGNSWSRTSLALTTGGPRLVLVRARLATMGLTRLLAGSSQAAAGVLSRSLRHQAQGWRTAARGAGMLSGAFGYVVVEYRRPPAPRAGVAEPVR